jgi:beta-galactosidase
MQNILIHMSRSLLLFIACFVLISTVSNAQNRTIDTLTNGWKFYLGSNPMAFNENFDDHSWENVRIPHDWAIHKDFIIDGDGNTGKLPWKGEGWYRRNLDLTNYKSGQRVYLLFDGVMAFPSVYINGALAGSWDYGYNSFYLDITEHIKAGAENQMAVHVDTRNHDSRWYPGAGIYRKVQLIVVPELHIGIWGTQITTPIIKNNYADVHVRTSLKNKGKASKTFILRQKIISPAGRLIEQEEQNYTLQGNQVRVEEQHMLITDPERWDIDDPKLYTLITEVIENGKEIDNYRSSFGVRTMRFTADHGFYLNDRRVQLKGVNLHHDLGPLGAAFNRRALERQLEIMLDMGINAVRNSHNVAAPELLELCDAMGILVFNEIFDKYDAKADILDTTDFDAFAERNIKNFIERDRNHPSVFLWSVGNEIGDVQINANGGFEKLRTMVNYVRKYDISRPVTLVCDAMNSATLRHFDFYDIHAWNYGRRYRLARKLEPNKSVIISESASTLSTRGYYSFPLPTDKTDFTNALQISSYDLNAPWWAEIADDDFMWQQDEGYVAGEFVWTGFDYLGEPTPYNNKWVKDHGMTDKEASRSSYFGAVDICGIPKDRYYLYRSYWNKNNTTIHILPHWNWKQRTGKNVPVFAYTNGDCAELFLNDKSLGKRCKNPKSENSTDRFRLMWNDVTYEAGTLKLVAYKSGLKIGEKEMRTAGAPAKLRLSPDQKILKADGEDLSYILVEALDKEGLVCPLADQLLDITVGGDIDLVGIGNGNPQSFYSFSGKKVPLFYGKAMIIVRSRLNSGKGSVVVKAKELEEESIQIEIEN